MRPKGTEGIANSVDPGQTTPLEQSDLGAVLFVKTYPKTWDHYGR